MVVSERWLPLNMAIFGTYPGSQRLGGGFKQFLFKQASACQPPTREICCIGPGIVDSWEKELYIMMDIMYIYIYISKFIYVYFEGLIKTTWCWHPLPLHAWSAPCKINPTFRTTPPGLQFLRKSGPNFQNTGLEIEPRFPAKPLRRKSVPNLGRSWGESSLQPFGCKLARLQLGQIQVASAAIHLRLLHGHRPRSRPDQIQNPKSEIQNRSTSVAFLPI